MKKFLFNVLALGILFYSSTALATTKYIVMNAAAFSFYEGTCYHGLEATYIIPATTGTCAVYAPIMLPSTATLSSVTVYYKDNSSAGSVKAYLQKQSNTSSSTTTLSSSSPTTNSSSIQSTTVSYSTSISSSYNYFVYINLTGSTTNLEAHSVKITYTE
jgi:hypothetical protein